MRSPAPAAEILTIGDELLIGQVVNTNQASIARQLNGAGYQVASMRTVGDRLDDILAAFSAAAASFDVVTVTGGLGPTHDDITRAAVCAFIGTPLVHHPETLSNIRALFGRRNLAVTPINEDQAMVPSGVTIIPNRLGTSPGFQFKHDRALFFIMPGVPYEMQAMMQESVIPYLQTLPGRAVIRHRTIKTTGIAESHLAELLGETAALLGNAPGLTLAYLPGPKGVRLRLSSVADDEGTAEMRIRQAEERIVTRAAKHIYGFDDEDLESIVGGLLVKGSLTIAVAESCTGGLVADRLTDVSGSSAYVERGFVTYSDASKSAELGVPADLIERHGAVSKEVAESMAEGARRVAGAHIGLSTTGIAGPTGGTESKPIGLVYVGYSDREGTTALRFHFGGDRRNIKERAAQAALELLRRKLSPR